jgi:hypothetical protein
MHLDEEVLTALEKAANRAACLGGSRRTIDRPGRLADINNRDPRVDDGSPNPGATVPGIPCAKPRTRTRRPESGDLKS